MNGDLFQGRNTHSFGLTFVLCGAIIRTRFTEAGTGFFV